MNYAKDTSVQHEDKKLVQTAQGILQLCDEFQILIIIIMNCLTARTTNKAIRYALYTVVIQYS